MLKPLAAVVSLWLAVSPVARAVSAWTPPLGTARSAPSSVHSNSPDSPDELLALSDDELRDRLESDPASVGSLSIGSAGSAILFNPVPLPEDPRWQAAPNAQTWGTSETMAAIATAIGTVNELFADTVPLYIGDISDPDGGRLKRHDSHQGGRDVDFGFYYTSGKSAWFIPGSAKNLDLPRNWALVRALVTRTDVQFIFLDTRIQRLLYKYALGISEDKEWLDRVFQFSRGVRDAIIQHLPGHRTHYHVRFYNAVAQELGRRAHPLLVELNLIEPPVFTVKHVVRRGETLGGLAARYHTTAAVIRRTNGLRGNLLRAGRAYRIPVRAAVPADEPIVVPVRRLPPETPPLMAAVAWPTLESLYGEKVCQFAVRTAAAVALGVPLL